MMNDPWVYQEILLNEIWRVVSLVDRNPYSKTRGSFSRVHWGWKFDDFPYPRMQEGLYTLCRIYGLEHQENPFFQSNALQQWIEWGFDYWTSLQHTNGSFDEAYPNEQCLAATAFTSFYIGSAYLLWRDHLPSDVQTRVETCFANAGNWLCKNSEWHGILSNHLAVAVAALELLSEICKKEKYRRRAEYFLERILSHQSKEGWMKEYDGVDIGYGTHGFFYLAYYWQRTKCERTLHALLEFAEFLQYCVHPDGTIGGEYSSRNTEFYYPAGFEILASRSSTCASIACFLRKALHDRNVCGIWSMDQFNLFPMLNNLFFAHDFRTLSTATKPLPCQQDPFERYFPISGLWMINRPHFYAVIGLSKGGTVSLFDKGKKRLAARFSGYLVQSKNHIFTSQDYHIHPEVQWNHEYTSVKFSVSWKAIQIPVFTPPSFLAFRIFTLTLGCIPSISRWVKKLLVTVLIARKKRPAIDHQRMIQIVDDQLIIKDRLSFSHSYPSVVAAEYFTAIHMGSSMYADIRSIGAGDSVQRFPFSKQMSLQATLDLHGAIWEVIDS